MEGHREGWSARTHLSRSAGALRLSLLAPLSVDRSARTPTLPKGERKGRAPRLPHQADSILTTFNALFREGAASFEDMSLAAIAKLVLREGCMGEAVAAERTCDPAVRAVLQRIARDEQAHAELAFQFLSWAFAQASRAERALLGELFGEMARA